MKLPVITKAFPETTNLQEGEDTYKSEDTYKHMARFLPVALYTTDSEGLITFYNEKAAELWGRRPRLNDPTELLFCGSWKLYEPNGTVMPHSQCPMARVLRDQQPFREEEICIERPDGSRISALVNIDPILAPDGRLEGAVNVFYDITKYKSTEEHFRVQASIVASSEDAIISKDLTGIIKSWNYGAHKIFGYTEKEAVGKPITMLIPPDRQDEEEMILNRIYKGEQVKHFETIRVTREGKYIPISLTISPIKNDKGEVIGASKIARDISESRQLQQQLQEYTEKLNQLNSYKDEFIGIASHELKTPLTTIKAYLQLLERELQDEMHQLYVNKTLHHVEKLTRLVSELLDVSKIQAGKLEFNFTDFYFNELLNEAIQAVQQTNPTHRILYKEEMTDIRIHADQHRLEQVIINLLSNAIKYSPHADEVRVHAIKEGNHILVSIKDFGIGIPSSELDKLFSRFFRVKGLSPNIQGLGMGLYISDEIIKGHKGKMWVESELGKGSTFYFSLPLS
ncbi:MAG TPA: PAS domain S-box protein [Puia sp.]